ncbi:MAG: PepSY-like domain-containing protein [Odoribacter sp.]|nr:PepSY-like domain-containing protein [Odoribacter sp.]
MKSKLLFAVAAIMYIIATSCSDTDYHPIPYDMIPKTAQTFLDSYYRGINAIKIEKDKDSYEVCLANGTEIEFDHHGSWKKIEAPHGVTVPDGIIPPAILSFIYFTYPYEAVNEISRDKHGYEVTLTNGIDLEFDHEGNFIRLDT